VSECWQSAYVAVTVAVGDSVDEAVASLREPLSVEAHETVHGLRSDHREGRVRALARAISEVALAVDSMGLS
jgi:hypothetical protein